MQFDIQTTIQDNVRLKKALQMSKFSYDKLQRQYKQLQSIYQQSLQRNKSIKQDYCQLQKKYQQSFTQNMKDNNSLIHQIQQLKKVIQNKQRQLEHIQIKLIPNLDQDMLRVKLITQMEGPYQQVVDKKDKEIQKYKHKVSQLERKLEIQSLGSKSKLESIKKERDQLKSKYQQENSKLMKELNMALSRNQLKSVEASIMKNQKKQIQQLKVTLQFMNKNQQLYQQDLKNLKQQRNHLLEKLKYLNEKQALFISGKNEKNQIQALKQQKNKLNLQINKIKTQNEKYQRLKQKLQQQKYKIQSQLQKQLTNQRNKFSTERSSYNNEINQLKQQLKRLKNLKIDTQTDRQRIMNKVDKLEKQLYEKSREIQRLVLESSRVVNNRQIYQQKTKGIWDLCKNVNKNQSQNQINLENVTKKIKKRNVEQEKAKQKQSNKKFEQLKNENQKLKKKLNEANNKIVELLKQKMKNKSPSQIIEPQRDRTISNIEKSKGIFLQYQDCGFKPLIQPTLYTYVDRTSKRIN